MADRMPPNRRPDRNEGSPRRARIVRCTGNRCLCSGRARWATDVRRASRGRPAPSRLPPQVVFRRNPSCSGSGGMILNMGSIIRRVCWGVKRNRRRLRGGGVNGRAVDMPGCGRQTAHSPWTNAQTRLPTCPQPLLLLILGFQTRERGGGSCGLGNTRWFQSRDKRVGVPAVLGIRVGSRAETKGWAFLRPGNSRGPEQRKRRWGFLRSWVRVVVEQNGEGWALGPWDLELVGSRTGGGIPESGQFR
jgi:hypothetical protein